MSKTIDFDVLQKILKEHENEFIVNTQSRQDVHLPGVCTVCKFADKKDLTPYKLHMNGCYFGNIWLCADCEKTIEKYLPKE